MRGRGRAIGAPDRRHSTREPAHGERIVAFVYYSLVRRSAWLRALIALWALVFTAVLSGAPGLHACPVHGEGEAHATPVAGAGHAMQMAGGVHVTAPADQRQHEGVDCTCLGLCCAPAVGAPARNVELLVDGTLLPAPPPETIASIPILWRTHVLPFANGPPASSRVRI